MRKIWYLSAVAATCLGLGLAVGGCGPAKSGQGTGRMDAGRMDGGKTDHGKMGGDKMDHGKMDGDKMGKDKMDKK